VLGASEEADALSESLASVVLAVVLSVLPVLVLVLVLVVVPVPVVVVSAVELESVGQ